MMECSTEADTCDERYCLQQESLPIKSEAIINIIKDPTDYLNTSFIWTVTLSCTQATIFPLSYLDQSSEVKIRSNMPSQQSLYAHFYIDDNGQECYNPSITAHSKANGGIFDISYNDEILISCESDECIPDYPFTAGQPIAAGEEIVFKIDKEQDESLNATIKLNCEAVAQKIYPSLNQSVNATININGVDDAHYEATFSILGEDCFNMRIQSVMNRLIIFEFIMVMKY